MQADWDIEMWMRSLLETVLPVQGIDSKALTMGDKI